MTITEQELARFEAYLQEEERGAGTIEKYLRDVRGFAAWLEGQEVSKSLTLGWGTRLLELGYAPVTVNSMLSAMNRLLRFLGREDCRVKYLRLQRRTFRSRGWGLPTWSSREW